MQKVFVILSLIIIAGAASSTSAAQEINEEKESVAIRLVFKNYEEAWNRHDAKGIAEQYHTDATWVNWFGAYYKSRAAIYEHYQTIHETYYKSSHFTTNSIEDISFVTPGVAIAHVRADITGDERYPGQIFRHRRTIVVTKREGDWRILAGQNAKLREDVN